MKKSGSNKKDIAIIAVPSVAEARAALLGTGLFEVCPGSDDSVIDKENGVQVRLVNIGSKNGCPVSSCLKTGNPGRDALCAT
jgi:hypothetical protein